MTANGLPIRDPDGFGRKDPGATALFHKALVYWAALQRHYSIMDLANDKPHKSPFCSHGINIFLAFSPKMKARMSTESPVFMRVFSISDRLTKV